MESTFFILAILGFYIVGVGAVDDPHGRGINTYAKHVYWRRRDRGMKNFIFSFDGMLYFRFTW